MNSVLHAERRRGGNIMILVLVLTAVLMLISVNGLQRLQQQARLATVLEQNLHLRSAAAQLLNAAGSALDDHPETQTLERNLTLSGTENTPPLQGRWRITALSTATAAATRYFELSALVRDHRRNPFHRRALQTRDRLRSTQTRPHGYE